MNVKPMIRDNIALNAFPEGCKKNIENQIEEIKNKPMITDKPLNVLIIGGSSGYGLSSRVVLGFNAHAYTYNVSFERAPKGRSTGSAGYYNNLYYAHLAHEQGIESDDLNADCFAHETKQTVIEAFNAANRKIDLVVYSVASGIRIDPDTQEKYVSALKPIGGSYAGYNVDIGSETLFSQTLDPATPEEIENTVRVMGGSDYALWARALVEADLLNPDCRFVTYTYLGSPVTHAIYKDGTIGHAKRDLEATNAFINSLIAPLNGKAIMCASKAVVTRASVFIPTMALYASALFKVMQAQGNHETTVAHKYRLFHDMIYGNHPIQDSDGIVRLDAYEMLDTVQSEVATLLEGVTPENYKERVGFATFKHEFLAINGFDLEGVNYSAE